MIASTQLTNTKLLAFIGSLIFKETANVTVKLPQNYKRLVSEIFRIHLKHVSDDLSVLFLFARLYL